MRTFLLSFVLALGACQSCGCGNVLPVEDPAPDASETLVPDATPDAAPDAGFPSCESVGCPTDQPLTCVSIHTCLCPQPDGSNVKCSV